MVVLGGGRFLMSEVPLYLCLGLFGFTSLVRPGSNVEEFVPHTQYVNLRIDPCASPFSRVLVHFHLNDVGVHGGGRRWRGSGKNPFY